MAAAKEPKASSKPLSFETGVTGSGCALDLAVPVAETVVVQLLGVADKESNPTARRVLNCFNLERGRLKFGEKGIVALGNDVITKLVK